MKKVINGKRYDTDTAQEVAEWKNGDFTEVDKKIETLYRKKTGEYFLHGIGGGNTEYRGISGNNFGPGEIIKPLTLQEAQAWAQEKLSGEEYEQIFEVEDEMNQVLNVLIPVSLHESLREEAKRRNTTIKSVVVERLENR